jgi:hypothetical protein
MGLHFAPNWWVDLEHGIAAAAAKFDFERTEVCVKSFSAPPSMGAVYGEHTIGILRPKWGKTALRN